MPHSLAAPVHSELTIKKSRFIGCVQTVADRAQAQAVVAALWDEHPGATHVCWALMAGGHSAAVDDGEPAGTAGRPMLEVLRHQDLDGVLATVVRYYGGTPLGAGGLVRAYTEAVASALKTAVRVPRQRLLQLHCELPYAQEGWLRRVLARHGATLDEVQHGAQVHAHFSLPEAQAPALRAELDADGQGRLAWHPVQG